MLHLDLHITINNQVHIKSVLSFVIKKSVTTLIDTCDIHLPLSGITKEDPHTKEKKPTQILKLIDLIKVGAPINIKAGYEETGVNLIFSGVIDKIRQGDTLLLQCVDKIGAIRHREIQKSWQKVDIKDIIKEATGLDMHPKSASLQLQNISIQKASALKILEQLKKQYGVFIYLLDNQVYMGLAYALEGNRVRFHTHKNVIQISGLARVDNSENTYKIKAINIKRDGSRESHTFGSGKEERTLFFYGAASESSLRAKAEEELTRLKKAQFKGAFTAFLAPLVRPSDIVDLVDPIMSERNGRYYVESVETSLTGQGGRQKISIAYKI